MSEYQLGPNCMCKRQKNVGIYDNIKYESTKTSNLMFETKFNKYLLQMDLQTANHIHSRLKIIDNPSSQ